MDDISLESPRVDAATKQELLEALGEIVHENNTRPDGAKDYSHGFEAGFAYACLLLNIGEAASPERLQLPAPEPAQERLRGALDHIAARDDE